jgi:ligand-binding SRPBCC domain-containing protein
MGPPSVSDLSRNKAIKRLDFPSLLPAPIEEVWRVTTDFDFVVHLLKPWFTITYDRSNAGHELAAGWTKDTDWKLLGIIPYGRWHEEIVEWEPPYRFVDSITNTPFPFWRHTHLYERRGDSTLYTDRLDIDPGWMGAVGLGFIKMIWAPRLVKLRRHFEQNRRPT